MTSIYFFKSFFCYEDQVKVIRPFTTRGQYYTESFLCSFNSLLYTTIKTEHKRAQKSNTNVRLFDAARINQRVKLRNSHIDHK